MLLAIVAFLIGISVALLGLVAERLAIYIPFSLEEELVSKSNFIGRDDRSEVTQYLQRISKQLEEYIDTPEGIHYTIHYSESTVKNAYATLGGHIYIFRGLLMILPNENALAMVIAHEMAHIKYRHPVIALGRGVVIGLFLASLSGFSGDKLVGQIVNNTGMLTLLKFNRDQEREADRTALAAVAGYYGHVTGAADLFKILEELEEANYLNPPLILSTHPLNRERIENIYRLARDNGWRLIGITDTIPDSIQAAIQAEPD